MELFTICSCINVIYVMGFFIYSSIKQNKFDIMNFMTYLFIAILAYCFSILATTGIFMGYYYQYKDKENKKEK